MSNTFINVHTFDGKLLNLFTPSRIYTVDEKKEAFLNLIKLLTNAAAISATQTIINDMALVRGSNFQPANNIDASDLLIEIIQWVDNPDVLITLNEQLGDVKNLGICDSGRVTRLLQIWLAFVNAH